MDNDDKTNGNIISIPLSNDSKHCHIEGYLRMPKGSKGLVIFAHGSGSGRHSPRNQFVSHVLNNDRVLHIAVKPSYRRGRKSRCRNEGTHIQCLNIVLVNYFITHMLLVTMEKKSFLCLGIITTRVKSCNSNR